MHHYIVQLLLNHHYMNGLNDPGRLATTAVEANGNPNKERIEWSHLVLGIHFVLGWITMRSWTDRKTKHFNQLIHWFGAKQRNYKLENAHSQIIQQLHTVFLTFRKSYKHFTLYKSLDDTLHDIILFKHTEPFTFPLANEWAWLEPAWPMEVVKRRGRSWFVRKRKHMLAQEASKWWLKWKQYIYQLFGWRWACRNEDYAVL